MVEELIVPDAVYEELVVKGGDRPGAADVQRGEGIRRQTLRNWPALTHLPRSLAQGECEAILLAEEEGAPLLVDERKARDAAVQRGYQGHRQSVGAERSQAARHDPGSTPYP